MENSSESGLSTSSLTRRELDVLRLVPEGMSNRRISRILGISEKTVKNHLSAIYTKTGTTGRTQAALYAVRADLACRPAGRASPDTRRLTSREKDVLRLITEGMSNRKIAQHLAISEKTVKNHLSAIYTKTGTTDRTQAALYAVGRTFA
ncbi:response regulator transcription factor [Streptomyces afghaniensis]|uniref:response regulator transcription factor n=1 Tax=Streptomyces afghaniensis TaxID=66865 RepID=UPI0037B0BFA3